MDFTISAYFLLTIGFSIFAMILRGRLILARANEERLASKKHAFGYGDRRP